METRKSNPAGGTGGECRYRFSRTELGRRQGHGVQGYGLLKLLIQDGVLAKPVVAAARTVAKPLALEDLAFGKNRLGTNPALALRRRRFAGSGKNR